MQGVTLPLLVLHEHRVDIQQHSASRDRDATKELVETFVAAQGELYLAPNGPRLLVVRRDAAGQLGHLASRLANVLKICPSAHKT